MPIGFSQRRVARVQLGYTTAGCPGDTGKVLQWLGPQRDVSARCVGFTGRTRGVYSFGTVQLERSIENF